MSKIILFEDKKDCSGCQGCRNICPENAITMEKDEYGFLYPRINPDVCVECGLCKKVCAFQNEDDSRKVSIRALAASAADENLKKNSSSGGIFAALAEKFLEEGGLVAGCSFEPEGNLLAPRHILISSKSQLAKLQGSKYVMSDAGMIYKQIRQELAKGRKVLFSGTPCQVDALNEYLGDKEKENLLTVDIICHGTPSAAMFQDYLGMLEEKAERPIVDFKFRDKDYGWDKTGSITFMNPDGSQDKHRILAHRSSYYKNFSDGTIFRDSCYACKYAGTKRTGDLTLGDFWGIGVEYPEYVEEDFDEKKGVSCILVNTPKGEAAIAGLETIITRDAKLEKIIRHNGNLKEPSRLSPQRQKLLDLYKLQGYAGLEEQFKKSIGLKTYARDIWSHLPPKTKSAIKKVVKR